MQMPSYWKKTISYLQQLKVNSLASSLCGQYLYCVSIPKQPTR